MIGARVGSYVLTRKLGEGGMGVVYGGNHVQLGQEVAVKLLLPQYTRNQDIVARFFNEARAAARINHPGIVRVYDFGHLEDGSAYLVMELLAGESLSSRLQRGRLAPADAARIIRQLAGTLAAAHAAGIVHRDLKPDNVYLCPDPEVLGGERAKILDFGIAKLSDDGGQLSRTRTGHMMGTPFYMSPEQARGAREVDFRSDIYSVGCILFEMLTGRPPFDGEGVGEILGKHQFIEAPPPRTIDPSLPPALDALVVSTLAKDPAARPPSMTTLAEQLAPFVGAGGSSPPGPPGAPPMAAVPTTLQGSSGQVVPPADKPRGLLLPLVLSTFVGAGLVVSALLYFRDPKPEVAAVIDAGPQTAAVAVPKVPVVAVPDATEEPDDDEDEDEPDAMATPDAAVTPDAMPDWVAWLEVHEKKAKAFSAEGKCDAITPLVRAARERSTEAAARLDAIRKRCKPAKEVPPPRRPKPAPVPSPDPPGGPRDRAAILMGLKPLLGRIQACGQSTGQTGRVPVRILIAPGGDVQHVSITDPSVAGTPLAACVAQVVKTARFQKAETTSNVVFPFMVR